MEARGLGFDDMYGESVSIAPGETAPGDSFPYEPILVIPLVATDNEEAYELFLGPEAVDDTDPEVEWKRGEGDVRDPDSRRRKRSLALPTVCKDGPSSPPGGDEARLFWPTVAPGEYASDRVE